MIVIYYTMATMKIY